GVAHRLGGVAAPPASLHLVAPQLDELRYGTAKILLSIRLREIAADDLAAAAECAAAHDRVLRLRRGRRGALVDLAQPGGDLIDPHAPLGIERGTLRTGPLAPGAGVAPGGLCVAESGGVPALGVRERSAVNRIATDAGVQLGGVVAEDHTPALERQAGELRQRLAPVAIAGQCHCACRLICRHTLGGEQPLAQLRLGGALDLVAVALVGLAECLLERATGAYGRATTRAGVVRADLGIDHTDELLDRHGARAVVGRLVGRAVAGVGAGERGVARDVVG